MGRFAGRSVYGKHCHSSSSQLSLPLSEKPGKQLMADRRGITKVHSCTSLAAWVKVPDNSKLDVSPDAYWCDSHKS